jgi:hypothetical protein
MRHNPSVAYIVTSDGNMRYADMATISVLSVRESEPEATIRVVSDTRTVQLLRAAAHPLLNLCDHIVGLEVPEGSAVFRNRWIKTQLPRWFSGDAIHLDADTFVRGPVLPVFEKIIGFGGVANHNGRAIEEQIWSEDRKNERDLRWESRYKIYINGGVWWYRDTEIVRKAFRLWHEGWQESVRVTGRLMDQPSLNRALHESGVEIAILPEVYNLQGGNIWRGIPESVVWHFYESALPTECAFGRLAAAARTTSLPDLRKRVGKLARMSAPWPNMGLASPMLDRLQASRGKGSSYARDWLLGQRLRMLRHLLRLNRWI